MGHLLSTRDSQGLPEERGHFILRGLLPGAVFKFIILKRFNHHPLKKKKKLHLDTCHTSQQFKLYKFSGFRYIHRIVNPLAEF